jgi:hypothetical protein
MIVDGRSVGECRISQVIACVNPVSVFQHVPRAIDEVAPLALDFVSGQDSPAMLARSTCGRSASHR